MVIGTDGVASHKCKRPGRMVQPFYQDTTRFLSWLGISLTMEWKPLWNSWSGFTTMTNTNSRSSGISSGGVQRQLMNTDSSHSGSSRGGVQRQLLHTISSRSVISRGGVSRGGVPRPLTTLTSLGVAAVSTSLLLLLVSTKAPN